MNEEIPFNRASFSGTEIKNLLNAVDNGHISGGGPWTRQAEDQLAKIGQNSKVLLTTSCTHALELAARILRLGPGDEVIVPAYTFVSTASAFALTGARIVFADVDEETLNLQPESVRSLITQNTRAVCTVHYAGIANGIDALFELCQKNGVTLIEDNAHGFGAKFNGKALGTFGDMSTLSFHETKNVTCGEGGALALNDLSHLELAEILREKGTDRSRFLRGQVDKYTWVEVGSSWVASDLLAAVLCGQLEQFSEIQNARSRIWNAYDAEIVPWAKNWAVRTPHVPEGAEHSAHMYFLRFGDLEDRTSFIAHLKDYGISAVFHYQALNASAVGRSFGAKVGDCPVAEDAARTLVRLPIHTSMAPQDTQRVIEATLAFRPKSGL